jgi:hypothetical protein
VEGADVKRKNMKMIQWIQGYWYKIVFNDDTYLIFKLLRLVADGSAKIEVEYCDGQTDVISIPMHKKIVPLGYQSPC